MRSAITTVYSGLRRLDLRQYKSADEHSDAARP